MTTTSPRTLAPLSIAAAALVCLATQPAQAQASDPTLVDIGLELGFQDRLTHGRGQVAADFDGDGWTDFYINNTSRADLGNDESFILFNRGPDENGEFRFERGQTLVQGIATFGNAAADYDNDGDPDIFLAVGGQETVGLDYLFENDGNGNFTDVSEAAGIRGPKDANGDWVPTASLSGHWADYDRDGDSDLFVFSKVVRDTLDLDVPEGLGWRDSLFRNNGDGTFTDVSEEANIVGGVSTKTGAWGDYDNDGWMDIFIPEEEYRQLGTEDNFRLMRNMGDGTFQEMPLDEEALGVGNRTWASANADFNNDGLLDIFVFAHSRQGNTSKHVLLLNRGNWEFINATNAAGFDLPAKVMGCQIGDLNNDGYEDIITANGGPTGGEADRLYMNEFAEAGTVSFRLASSLFDYPAVDDPECVAPLAPRANAEGAFVASDGMSAAGPSDPGAMPAEAYAGAGGDACDAEFPYRGHAITFTDFDKDGDVDLPMIKGGTEIIQPLIESGEPNRFFRNDGGNALGWLFVELHGVVSSEDAVGARVEVTTQTADGGTRRIVRVMRGGRCFSASGPRELHFGLGTDTAVTSVRVDWPSGVRSIHTGIGVNERVRIDEPVQGFSNFNDGVGGWTPVSGDWQLVDQQYRQLDTDGRHVSVAGGNRANYTLSAKVTYLGGGQKVGVAGRVSADGNTYYTAILAGNTARLFKVESGVLTALGPQLPIDPMTPNKSYIVALRFQGSLIQMTVNGRSTQPFNDSSIASGRFGLATDGTSAAFDNVTVY